MLAMQQGYLTINLFQSIFLLHNETMRPLPDKGYLL